jgi:NAD(P)-dependent dehydrogenase (short-subunit alcohol dehydrogenase family)
MSTLEGRHAVVTGAARGIGLAVAERLHREGARVALLDLDGDAVRKVAATMGGVGIEVDVRDSASVDRAIGEAHDKLGGLSILVNNAGAGRLKPLHRYTDAEWNDLIGCNLSGTFFAMRAAIPLMLESGGGAIVNNASASAVNPTRGELPYSAAKAGVVALTQGAAQEYGPTIRVNAVSPGVIRTPMTELLFKMPEALDPVYRSAPLGRTGESEEVSDLIYFLCSDQSSFITGQNITIDGGMGLPQAGIDETLRWSLDMMAKAGKSRDEKG